MDGADGAGDMASGDGEVAAVVVEAQRLGVGRQRVPGAAGEVDMI